MLKRRIEIFLLIFSLIVLGYLIHRNQEQLYYIPSGKLIAKLQSNTPFEQRVEKIKYKGIFGNFFDNLIYFTGMWEPEVTGFLRDSMKKIDKNQGVFLDIGAYTGWHSLYMSQYAKTVHAVEPYPPFIERFTDMIHANHIDNIDVHPVGFSNQAGAFPFFLGTASFEPKFATYSVGTESESIVDPPLYIHNTGSSIQLPLVVGDVYLKAHGMERIDLIKIDIEGYERYALLGLKQILQTNRPVVAMELNVTEGGFSSKEQVIKTFPKNYQFFRIKPLFNVLKNTWKINLGTHWYVYGRSIIPHNEYSLEKFDFDFTKQDNLAVIPIEKVPLFQEEKARTIAEAP